MDEQKKISELPSAASTAAGDTLVGEHLGVVSLFKAADFSQVPSFADYAALRAYAGAAPVVHVTGRRIEGFFELITGAVPADDQGITVGRYRRLYSGPVNPQWWDARGDGVTDDTAAINAAIASLTAGGEVRFPGASYLISGPLNITVEGVTLSGANGRSTKIIQSNLNSRIINNTGMFFSFRNIQLDYSATPTGGQAIWSSGSYSTFQNFTIRQAFTSVFLTQGAAQIVENFNLLNYEQAGLHLKSINDVFVGKGIINAGDLVKGRLGGIRLEDKVEAFLCSKVDVLNGEYSLTSAAASFTQNNRPAYNFFTDCDFDSSAKGSLIDYMVETNFNSCWWSAGRVTGAAAPGATIDHVDSIFFTACKFFNCGAQGALLTVNGKRVFFNNCSWESNSVTAGDGVANGLQVASGATDWSVIGGKASNGLYPGKQGYGIGVGAACVDFVISSVNLKGNLTGSLNDASTTTSKTITANVGYVTRNKGTASVPVSQTVAVVTHGLAKTPAASDIMLTLISDPGASGVSGVLRVAALNATTFQIVTNAAVATNALSVAWQANL